MEEITQIEAIMRLSGGKERFFQVNYRLGEGDSSLGSRQQRYDKLIERLDSLKPAATHDSTSSWIVRSYRDNAQALLDALSPPLDGKLDSLHIVEIIHTNRVSWP